jgi:2,5-dihydroxypyridine 5,6-dioxygenase
MILAQPLPFQGGLADKYLPEPAVAATQNTDVWIDLCMPYIAGSKAYDEAVNNDRTRYFLGADIQAGGLTRIFGMVDLDKLFGLTNQFAALVARSNGREVLITSNLGTEVRFTLASPEGLAISKATRPGGYFVPGTVVFIPELETVKGKVVCEAAFHEYYTTMPEPLVFHVDGKIRAISGGGSERKVMDRALKRAGNGEYGNVVHFSCGHHPAARFTGTSFIEDQRVTGCDAVGLGLPAWLPGGGENHPDGVMKEQSIWIGGEQIMDDGVICGPPSLVEAAQGLELVYD